MTEGSRDTEAAVVAHWRDRMSSFEQVLARLREEGVDPTNPTVEEVNKIDLMHIGAEESTDTLAELAGITAQSNVLDAGCGIGGTSRRVAHTLGATVTGLDLTPQAVETANALNDLLGLNDRVHAYNGSVTDMPFNDDRFDVVLIQHCAMQVPDKDRLFSEVRRVLSAGGTLAMHDWFAGSVEPLNYPLPWAEGPRTSFLVSEQQIIQHMFDHDFSPEPLVDQTSRAVEIFRESRQRIGHHLELGRTLTESQRRTLEFTDSMILNLTDDRLRVGFLVAHLPD